MITKEETEYVMKVLEGALLRGTRVVDPEGGHAFAVVDVDAVLGAVRAAMDDVSPTLPPAPRREA